MRYYLGENFGSSYFHTALLETGGTGSVLFSFASEPDVNKAIKTLKRFEHMNVIVDSGAFSVWNSGRTMDRVQLLDYYARIKDYRPDIDFINLDVIPGERGRKPTKLEADIACKLGWENFLWFKEHGIKTLPVFHEDDNFDYLKMMMEETDFIAISPANDSHTKKRMKWLDVVFSQLKGDYKTHGLAATSVKLMERYPFYSVDSINWKAVLMYGRSSADNHEHVGKLARDKVLKMSMLKKEIKHFVEQEQYITKLWESRGIKW